MWRHWNEMDMLSLYVGYVPRIGFTQSPVWDLYLHGSIKKSLYDLIIVYVSIHVFTHIWFYCVGQAPGDRRCSNRCVSLRWTPSPNPKWAALIRMHVVPNGLLRRARSPNSDIWQIDGHASLDGCNFQRKRPGPHGVPPAPPCVHRLPCG